MYFECSNNIKLYKNKKIVQFIFRSFNFRNLGIPQYRSFALHLVVSNFDPHRTNLYLILLINFRRKNEEV